jgi:hypothetical protein
VIRALASALRRSTTITAALLLAANAWGHTGGTTGFATVTLSGQTVRYSLALAMSSVTPDLADRMRLGQPGFAPDYRPLLASVEQHLHISTDGRPCEATPGDLTPPATEGGNISIVVLFACASPPRELAIRDDLFDVLGHDYHTLANIEWKGGSQQFVFQPDIRETKVAIQAGESASGAGSFFSLGIQHILFGFDHLLFLLALVLRGGNLWSLLKIVTAFTIAHSITLALAVFNVLVLPDWLVQAVIALSISYVAAENLFMQRPVSHRWAVSFLFGLVHGVGFSSVLRELNLPAAGIVWPLLSFNLGVEAGQVIAVAAALPLILWARQFKWEPRAVAALSGLVLVVGLGLFVERVLA